MGVGLAFVPKWFAGLDCIFEGFSVIVLLMLAFSTYRLYKFTKDKHHLYFGVSFMVLALGFIAKILTNVEIYYPEAVINTMSPEVVYGITSVVNSLIIFSTGYFFYRFFVLLGFLGLIFIITHSKEYRWIPLTAYFVLIISLFSLFKYYVFHITAAVLLFYVAYYFFKNWWKIRKKKKTKKSAPFLIFLSFLLLFVSAVLFIFVMVHQYFYVVAEGIQFLGFLVLLMAYIILMKK